MQILLPCHGRTPRRRGSAALPFSVGQSGRFAPNFISIILLCALGVRAADLPVLRVTAPTILTQSCRISIPAGLVIPDSEGKGAIQIAAPDIVIDFTAGSVLRGSAPGTTPDQYRGYGIRLNGHAGVTIRGARVSGFWCGISAAKADRLTLEEIDASDNRRARLKSSPVAEDGSDWLFGHDNDEHQWLKNYAAAIYIEQSRDGTVRDCRVWHGQNALCLDRVRDSKVYDNDFSFNSGWGIAMWRCESNIISRNALDFCVRGYSHGVYNRGQDSAGIFAFEQNNRNIFAENSVTHGGDGFFGFAGREALGERGSHPPEWYRRKGNSGNLLIGNDFSYAAAHGIENTFSFDNNYLCNLIVGNAICGIWAGYSRNTLIGGNYFEANGDMGYGLERGGVNIDHGGDNLILQNSFVSNKCGVHLWGGANRDFDKRPWAKANGYDSTGSLIAGNNFKGDLLAYQFRGPGQVVLGSNALSKVGKELMSDASYVVSREPVEMGERWVIPAFHVLGVNHPFGARPDLHGRENIIMTEWGPWDHEEPLVRLVKRSGGAAIYEVLKVPSSEVRLEHKDRTRAVLSASLSEADKSTVTISPPEAGVWPYQVAVQAKGKTLSELSGTLIAAKWETKFFKWPADIDPRKDLQRYRKLADGSSSVSASLDELSLRYGMRGPSDLGLSDAITAAKLGRDHFGMIARTRLPLTRGTWQIAVLSDDGLRVTVDGKALIDNWTWHGPTEDKAELNLESDKTVEIVVEHFQIDGYAVLDFSISASTSRVPGR